MKVNFVHPDGKEVLIEDPTDTATEVYLKHGFEAVEVADETEQVSVETATNTGAKKPRILKRLLRKKGK